MKQVIAGVDIGGTKIAVALENAADGRRLDARALPTRADLDAGAAIEPAFAALEAMLAVHDARLTAIGIGCPSPLDLENGLVMSPSNLRHWDRFPIVRLFRERFDGARVALENDANAAALGEAARGAGRGLKNLFYVTVSTGIGGAIVLDGAIYHGVGGDAGEIGHTIVAPDGVRCNCGSVGCLETICAGVHIARRARDRAAAEPESLLNALARENGEEISAKTVLAALRRGDSAARAVWDETCRYLALGIGNVVTLLAPAAVVIGGGIAAAAGEDLFAPLRRLVPGFVSMVPADKIRLVPAALGADSGLVGALELARRAAVEPNQNYEVSKR